MTPSSDLPVFRPRIPARRRPAAFPVWYTFVFGPSEGLTQPALLSLLHLEQDRPSLSRGDIPWK
jgi:hypothetical protein